MTHPTLCVGGPLNGQVVDRRGVAFYGCIDRDLNDQVHYRLQKVSERVGDPAARCWFVFATDRAQACDAVALAIKLNIKPLGNPHAIDDDQRHTAGHLQESGRRLY